MGDINSLKRNWWN